LAAAGMAFLTGVRAGRDTPTHIRPPSYNGRPPNAQPPLKSQASPETRGGKGLSDVCGERLVVGTPEATCIIEPLLA